MKLKAHKIKTLWQFRLNSNAGQPPFVHVTTALSGPRCVAKPPATKADPYQATFYLAPLDWLVQLDTDQWIHISDHTKFHLVDMKEEKK